jgi:uncharacterized protein (DUF433 family)
MILKSNHEQGRYAESEVLGGESVFVGTRVPAKSLFDHLKAGDSIEQFLKAFPA